MNMKFVRPEEALAGLRSGMRVFIGSGCATPQKMVAALAARGPEVFDVEIIHILTFAAAPYAKRELLEHFRHNAFFIGPNVRDAVNAGVVTTRADVRYVVTEYGIADLHGKSVRERTLAFIEQTRDFAFLYDRGATAAWVGTRWSIGDTDDLLLKRAVNSYLGGLFAQYPEPKPGKTRAARAGGLGTSVRPSWRAAASRP